MFILKCKFIKTCIFISKYWKFINNWIISLTIEYNFGSITFAFFDELWVDIGQFIQTFADGFIGHETRGIGVLVALNEFQVCTGCICFQWFQWVRSFIKLITCYFALSQSFCEWLIVIWFLKFFLTLFRSVFN